MAASGTFRLAALAPALEASTERLRKHVDSVVVVVHAKQGLAKCSPEQLRDRIGTGEYPVVDIEPALDGKWRLVGT